MILTMRQGDPSRPASPHETSRDPWHARLTGERLPGGHFRGLRACRVRDADFYNLDTLGDRVSDDVVRDAIEGAHYVEIDGTPHGVLWTHAYEVTRELVAFVGQERFAAAPG